MMVPCVKKTVFTLMSFFVCGMLFLGHAEECKECIEVAKGKIPPQFLDKSIKSLPSDIAIWDSPEAIEALNDPDAKILWVDTRPESFYTIGRVKGSVLLLCDLKGAPITGEDKKIELTEEKLRAAMAEIDPDISKVKVAYFCQGPACHRSYNAAIRSVSDYGFPASQIIWFRDGYPGLLEYVNNDPKLKKRITRYLEGTEIAK